jgi:putative transposase
MPRRLLHMAGGHVCHVFNRGANRSRIFHDGADYAAFERLLVEALRRYPAQLYAYCLMSNHWHFALRPDGTQLPRLMHWLCMTHAKRSRARHETTGSGCVYQGRYSAIPVQSDYHLLALLRYIERNPVRAGLVGRAEDWPWSSVGARSGSAQRVPLAPLPFTVDRDWTDYVNDPTAEQDVRRIRLAITAAEPLGDSQWVASLRADSGSRVEKTATRLPESDLTN